MAIGKHCGRGFGKECAGQRQKAREWEPASFLPCVSSISEALATWTLIKLLVYTAAPCPLAGLAVPYVILPVGIF